MDTAQGEINLHKITNSNVWVKNGTFAKIKTGINMGYHPHNWTPRRQILLTLIFILIAFCQSVLGAVKVGISRER